MSRSGHIGKPTAVAEAMEVSGASAIEGIAEFGGDRSALAPGVTAGWRGAGAEGCALPLLRISRVPSVLANLRAALVRS